MMIDNISRKILDLIQRNGRISTAEIAKRVAMSETPCWRRLKQMESEGVIEGYHARLNRRKLGLGVMAFVQLQASAHDNAATDAFQKTIKTRLISYPAIIRPVQMISC